MAIELNCRDLGVADCDWTATGETPEDVVEQAVEHLKKEHNIKMPDPEVIMEGKFSDDPLNSEASEEVRLVVTRMREELDIVPTDEPPDAEPAIVKVTTR